MTEAEASDVIQRRLAAVERTNDVRILMAVESGSRAWGFPSRDSDYDVRFVYAHPKDWYLSLAPQRDVIETPIEDLIDLTGWDIRKALRLFAKANPPLVEWLTSPIVYRDERGFRSDLQKLLPTYYEEKTCMYHYLHMARGNFRHYLQGTTVWIKKYLYVLRPLLAVRWIEQGRGPVPMSFQELLITTEGRTELRAAIEDLIARKRAGDELDRGPANPTIGEFISVEMERLAAANVTGHIGAPDLVPLQRLFIDRVATIKAECT